MDEEEIREELNQCANLLQLVTQVVSERWPKLGALERMHAEAQLVKLYCDRPVDE